MKKAPVKAILRRFFPYLKQYPRHYLQAFVGILLVSGGTAATAWLVKPLLDEIFMNKDKEMLALLPAAIVVVYFLTGVGRFVQAYSTAYVGQDVIRKIRDQLLERVVSMELAFFHKNTTGALISRITQDTARIQTMVSNALPNMVRDAVTVLGLLGVVIAQSPKLAFFALVVIPAALYPLSLLARRMRKISRKSQETAATLTSRLTEIFNNVEAIKSYNGEAFEGEKFRQENRRFFRLAMKGVATNNLVLPLMETLGAVGVAVVIFIGGKEVIDGQMTVGTFFSFTAALFMLYTPVQSISKMYNQMQDAVAAGERIFRFLDLEPAMPPSGGKTLETIDTVKLENVHLRYGEHHALRGVGLFAKRGETIALVGDSGGGKSSLVNLLVRFYDPSEGRVLFNGLPAPEYDLGSLRERIAMVTQRVFIFQDTVAANVAYGKPVDDEAVEQALKEANAWEFVAKLPHGIHTPLDEFGANLSGGQRQRISIARAIYKHPDLLILDEATSALDAKSEALIQEALERFTRDKITFVIAHRLGTVKNADKIAVLRHGEIIATGTDEQLSKSCPEYQKLKLA